MFVLAQRQMFFVELMSTNTLRDMAATMAISTTRLPSIDTAAIDQVVMSGRVDQKGHQTQTRRVWDCHRTADQARGGEGVNVGIYGSPMECLGKKKATSLGFVEFVVVLWNLL